jgi:TPR repeat protein
MSFVVTVWAQPHNTPLPADVMQAAAQLEQLQEIPGTQPEPRFLTLARALAARYPDDEDGEADMYDHGLSLLERSPDNDQTYTIGIYTHNDDFDAGYRFLITQANRLGMHVMDEQNGLVHLASGQVLRPHEDRSTSPSPPSAAAPASIAAADRAADPVLAETIEQAKLLGIDPERVIQAQQGLPHAQYNLGLLFKQTPTAPTSAQVKLAYIWMERAVAQDFVLAKSFLGRMTLQGWGDVPRDVKRGFALLEEAAAADDLDALKALADAFYRGGVRTLSDGTIDKPQDQSSIAARARVPGLLMRAAAQGDMEAAKILAECVWHGIGNPQDDLTAKALLQLVRRRDASELKDRPELQKTLAPTKAEQEQVDALTDHYDRHLKDLPSILDKRWAPLIERRLAQLAAKPTQQPTQQQAHAKDQAQAAAESDPKTPRAGWHAGMWATLAAAIGFVLLMMLATSTSPASFKIGAAIVGVIGAFGVWRTTADLEWGGFRRVLMSAAALVPGAGFFACVWVLWAAISR